MGVARDYKLWPVLTYSKGYWEMYNGFHGDFLAGLGLWRGGMMGELFMKESVLGEDNFHKGSTGLPSIILKKWWKNKYEKASSTESQEQH